MEKYEVYYDITLIGFLWVNEDYKYRYEPFYEGVERVREKACLLRVMENGTERLKGIAKEMTLSNENDGVAHALEKFVLKNKQ